MSAHYLKFDLTSQVTSGQGDLMTKVGGPSYIGIYATL